MNENTPDSKRQDAAAMTISCLNLFWADRLQIWIKKKPNPVGIGIKGEELKIYDFDNNRMNGHLKAQRLEGTINSRLLKTMEDFNMKKMMLAFIFALLFQAATATAEAFTTLWAPQGNIVCFSSNGKMGIQDLDGAVLCDAVYNYIGYFDEYGFAEIRIGDRKGVIRADGEVVVPPIHCNSIGYLHAQHAGYTEVYDEAFLFSTMQNNKAQYGFYALDGRLITEACWDKAYGFKNGVAYVQKNGKWNMINMKGELLLEDWWDSLYIDRDTVTLSTDLKKVQMDTNGIVFAEYSCKNGKWVLSTLSQQHMPSEIACEYVMKVSDGYYYQADSKWGMMDKNGSIIYPPQWDQVTATPDANYFLVKNDEKMGLLDQVGNLVMDSIYDNISYIAADRWIVRKDNFAAVMNHSGNVIQDLSSGNYAVLYPVGNEYIQYETDSAQWGFMDSDGMVLSCVDGKKIRPQTFGEYAEGWIEVEIVTTSEIGYMHLDGRILSSPDWSATKPFSNGFAAVKLASTDKWIHIAQSGEPVYSAGWYLCDNYMMAMAGPIARVIQRTNEGSNLYGFINSNGQLLNGLNPF